MGYLIENGIDSDAYVFVPCFYDKNLRNVVYNNLKHSKENDIITIVETINKNEVTKDIDMGISRTFLEDIELTILSDSNKDDYKKRVFAELYLSFQDNTKTAVLIIVISNVSFELTYLFDQISRDMVYIQKEGADILLNEYIASKYALVKRGTSRTLTYLSKKPDNNYMRCLLANEAFQSDWTLNSLLISRELDVAIHENIAQFNFSEIYGYDTGLVQVLNDFKPVYSDRKYVECLTVFIVEFLQFQEATVSRVNSKVSRELDKQEKLSIKKILEINQEFSKSVKFWNVNIYVYPSTQKIVNSIHHRFELDQNMKVFHDNKNILEHIISTHSVISSERENKMLNYTVLFLTLTQVIPIYYNLYQYFVKNGNFVISSNHFVMFILIVAIIGILKVRVFKNWRK
jgi:hypothetical protein